MGLYLGIDLGTSGVRIEVIDPQLKRVHHDTETFSIQTPNAWWDAIEILLYRIQAQGISQEVDAISYDATSSTVHLFNRLNSEIVSETLMYNDDRAKDWAQKIQPLLDKHSGAFGSTSTLAKVLWLLDQQKEEDNLCIQHQSDWLLYQLTGIAGISDENNALKLGYDPIQQSYPKSILQLLPEFLLPEVVPVGTVIGNISSRLVKNFGFKTHTQIIAGTTDSMAAWVASVDHLSSAVGVTSLGSTLAIKLVSPIPIFDPKRGVYSHRLKNTWIAGGASNSGGHILRHFFNDEQIKKYSNLMTQQSTQLDYYPLLKQGERFPYPDPHKKGKLSPRPESNAIFFQAILEGITQIEVEGYKALTSLGAEPPFEILTCGGGAQNAKWMEQRQKSLNCSVKKAPNTDAAYGAAKLASGWLESQI